MTTAVSSEKGIRALQHAGDILNEEHRVLYEYWLSKKGAALCPSPDSIDILDFANEAKLWAIVDVSDAGGSFRYRFVGTSIVELVELEPTGEEFSELAKNYTDGNFGTDLLEIYNTVLETKAPVINGPTHMPLPNKEYLQFSSLNLPLSHDGKAISEILTAVHMHEDL